MRNLKSRRILLLAPILLVMSFTSGCATVTTGTCPAYPDPPSEVVEMMFETNSPAVDRWLNQLERLREQLELCR